MRELFAYPNAPPAVGECIRATSEKLNASNKWQVTLWEEVSNWGAAAYRAHIEIQILALEHGISESNLELIVHHLLYYGVFGIRVKAESPAYIFDMSYDMRRLQMLREKFPDCTYVMHPILRPALAIPN